MQTDGEMHKKNIQQKWNPINSAAAFHKITEIVTSVQASTILVKPQYSSPAHHYSAVPLCGSEEEKH